MIEGLYTDGTIDRPLRCDSFPTLACLRAVHSTAGHRRFRGRAPLCERLFKLLLEITSPACCPARKQKPNCDESASRMPNSQLPRGLGHPALGAAEAIETAKIATLVAAGLLGAERHAPGWRTFNGATPMQRYCSRRLRDDWRTGRGGTEER
jgi:hypothetical protein